MRLWLSFILSFNWQSSLVVGWCAFGAGFDHSYPRAIDPFVDFLKSTEVGEREGTRERELEWQWRSDQAGEELHGG